MEGLTGTSERAGKSRCFSLGTDSKATTGAVMSLVTLLRRLPMNSPLPPAYATLTAHPFADTFPMIEGQAFEELKADILANGILQPITIWDDGSGLRIL